MPTPRDALTPDALTMIQAIAASGSFAAAARQAGMVPSALTYRVRQIEDALDVLLFDRSAAPGQAHRRRRRTAARGPAAAAGDRRGGQPRQARGDRLGDAAHRGRRQHPRAHGRCSSWCEAFYALDAAPTRERARRHHDRHARGADVRPGRSGHWGIGGGQQRGGPAAGHAGRCALHLRGGAPPPAGHGPRTHLRRHAARTPRRGRGRFGHARRCHHGRCWAGRTC